MESLKAVGRWTSRKKHLSNRKHFKSGNKPVEFVPVSAQNPTHFLLPPRTKAEPFFFCWETTSSHRLILLGGKCVASRAKQKAPLPQERKKKNSNPSAGSDRKSAGSNHHNNRYVRHSAQQKETSCRLVLLRPFHCSVTASQGCEMGMQR